MTRSDRRSAVAVAGGDARAPAALRARRPQRCASPMSSRPCSRSPPRPARRIEFRRLEAPAIVRGDRDEIVQVFQNLVQNAIKYGKRGGRIDVRVTREAAGGGRPARFVAAVKDDGPGIAPQHLPRLTERFYRVSAAASREKGGTGLGPRHRQAHPEPPSRRADHHLQGRRGLHFCRRAAGAGVTDATRVASKSEIIQLPRLSYWRCVPALHAQRGAR